MSEVVIEETQEPRDEGRFDRRCKSGTHHRSAMRDAEVSLSGRRQVFRTQVASAHGLASVGRSLPNPEKDGGRKTIDNVRLAHIYCNRWDFANRAESYLEIIRDIARFIDERTQFGDASSSEARDYIRERLQSENLRPSDFGLPD